jgi:hypothetical protein
MILLKKITNINKQNTIFIKDVSAPTAAETHLVAGLNLKLRFTVKVEKSMIDLVGMRRLTVSETDEQLTLPSKTLIRKRS